MGQDEQTLLDIRSVSVAFPRADEHDAVAVDDVSYHINKGEMLAVVGESGSGKSVSALNVLQLLPESAKVSGEVWLDGEKISDLGNADMTTIRGRKVGMIFQEPMTSLNPLHTIEKQIKEAIYLHQPNMTTAAMTARVLELMDYVELEVLKDRMHAYPHELSGGQRQRVMIAMALANEPELLIADEPTTALDVTVQAHVLNLLKKLQKKLGMAVLLITHDLTIVEKLADRVVVMHHGKVVEQGDVKAVFASPQADYTKHLLAAAPKGGPVPLKPDAASVIGSPEMKVYFTKTKNFFGKPTSFVKAVDGVGVDVKAGQTLGIVGESGSGKSTLCLAMMRLISSKGDITFDGTRIDGLDSKTLRPLRAQMQMVFQDPFSSLNPRMSIEQIVGEGLRAHNMGADDAEREELIDQALIEAGLEPDVKSRYPHEFSGGQRQRIGIARALAVRPKLIMMDEPTSALDLCTQAEILDTLKDLQQKHDLTYLFISHDLRVIKAISHHIIVMKEGVIVEQGTRAEIFDNPKHEYTQTLIKAAFEVA
jgi:microcin C transport system ATP-binding protein